jgi:hypothetical protein
MKLHSRVVRGEGLHGFEPALLSAPRRRGAHCRRPRHHPPGPRMAQQAGPRFRRPRRGQHQPRHSRLTGQPEHEKGPPQRALFLRGAKAAQCCGGNGAPERIVLALRARSSPLRTASLRLRTGRSEPSWDTPFTRPGASPGLVNGAPERIRTSDPQIRRHGFLLISLDFFVNLIPHRPIHINDLPRQCKLDWA